MTKKLKVAVIGAGGIFQWAHSAPLKNHEELEVVAIVDIDLAKAQAAAEQHGIPQAFSDYRDVIKMEEIDIIDICTPNLFHSEIAVAALEAGKHVFCEKPDAVNPDEAIKMQQAAATSGKVLMVMRNNRFRPASKFIKEWINGGNLGEAYAGRCGWTRRRGIPGKGGWFTTKELSGGGPLIDLGVHFIDLAIWFMGNPKPISVTGATYTKFADADDIAGSEHSKFGEKSEGEGIFDVEDLAIGFIRFDNGASLQIEFSWASNIEQEENFVELRGTKAGFRFSNGKLGIFGESNGTVTDLVPHVGEDTGGHGENLYHFVDVVQGRVNPIFTIDQGVDMIKILSAIYESARTGSEVKL
ncbi:Gfo/Idh/MocA family protein [Paenibacillus lignilyticus]|uniref:Gfo/Idh/MocA family oxidoreductase n=1 Tax=Paenibacillus lignilyticus TaxID=1172615 RepID=A0ABS5CC94_9BACL|nr:Gfo/Idh/MocA family oxidoreductase [Paenibacillus lignilyticus]MBP3961728.1 Gfo/Idh/MocA family oxidoreductase [Paenibacillus lignilyticus]MBP3963601.1 Gfo/Idh/MocA family oxidoreductase [Paenibacillus lignilyticus]